MTESLQAGYWAWWTVFHAPQPVSMFFGPSPVPDGISITPAGALEDVHLPRWISSKVHRMVTELVPDLRKC